MLLAVDVGNTNTVVGAFDPALPIALLDHWRMETRPDRTADEYAVLLRDLFALGGLDLGSVRAAIIASVVPATLEPLVAVFQRRLHARTLVVGAGLKTGMPILTENPREVGADRIVNAVAAHERFGAGCIVVDFGTATTFDAVSPKGEYLGGAIAPGLGVSAEALYHHTAQLKRVEIVLPRHAVGKSTVTALQAGLFWGYVGLVDGLVRRIAAELGFPVRVVATGGLAEVIAPASETITDTDPLLTLDGLRILFERNRPET